MKSLQQRQTNTGNRTEETTLIAQVLTVEKGLITEVYYDQQHLPIAACAHSVFATKVGDRVVCQRIDSQWIVLCRLASAGEPLAPALTFDGERWCLQSDVAFTLQVGRAEIVVSPMGDVTISGADIVTDASGVNRILGSRIELN